MTTRSLLAVANVVLTAAAGVFAVAGYVAIKRKNWVLHRNCMLIAFGLSAVFLVTFVARIAKFGLLISKDLDWPVAYWVIFVSHDALAVITIPLVVVAIVFGLMKKLEDHREVGRIAFPVWMYVTVTGIFMYFVLRQVASLSKS